MKKRLNEDYSDYHKGKIESEILDQKVQSYLGVLSHANQHELFQAFANAFWIRHDTLKKKSRRAGEADPPKDQGPSQEPSIQGPRSSELPQRRSADVAEVDVIVADVEARRSKATNNDFPSSYRLILATGVCPGIIA